MAKRDMKRELRELYLPGPKHVVQVTVPSLNFLMIDGEGDPNTAESYAAAVEALFALSYALKFMVKRGPLGVDYGVMPLEGLWWADDMSSFTSGTRDDWKWTMMIMQPNLIGSEMVEQAVDSVARKGLAALDSVRFEPFEEGLCAQTLHVGPFSEEAPTIEAVHEFISESGRQRVGKHHEIYLSDIRKADPAKWKTVIRQPMR